jgi:hypothetical protein
VVNPRFGVCEWAKPAYILQIWNLSRQIPMSQQKVVSLWAIRGGSYEFACRSRQIDLSFARESCQNFRPAPTEKA